MPTWVILPDFVLKPPKLPLGAIISHPKRPTDVLAVPGSATPPVTVPAKTKLDEKLHLYSQHSPATIL